MTEAQLIQLKIEHAEADLGRKVAIHEEVSKQLKDLVLRRHIMRSNIGFNELLILNSTDEVAITKWNEELQAAKTNLIGNEEVYIALYRKCNTAQGDVFDARCKLKDLKTSLDRIVG